MRRQRQETLRIKKLGVEVRNGNVDKAVRKLRKKVDEDGKLKRLSEIQHYEKPSKRKRLARKAAIKRHQKSLHDAQRNLENNRYR